MTTYVSIEDPAGRLPPGSRQLLPSDLQGTLFVPDRGAPVHPDSVRTLAKHMGTQQKLDFVPEAPIASELGLPSWDPVMSWVPGRGDGLWTRVRGRLGFASAPEVPAERIVETTRDEQAHYFATHYRVVAPKPIQVSVVVSNHCNLSCVMCPYHSPVIKPDHQTGYFDDRQSMTWELLDRLATECGSHGMPVKMGNIEEPLLHPNIIDFVRACRERGVPTVHITTNGLPLNERRIRELFDAGLTSIYVSMDASRPETYARVRGSDLEKVERNVRLLLSLREELGQQIGIHTSFVRNDGVSLEEVAEFREKWTAEADGVILYNLVEYEQGASLLPDIHAVVEEKMKEAHGRWACLNPFQEIYVLPDGRTYYCCETIGKLAFEELESMGQYPDSSLLDIWLGPGFEKLRRDLLCDELEDRSACRDCGIWMAHVVSTEESAGRRTTRNMITEIVQRV